MSRKCTLAQFKLKKQHGERGERDIHVRERGEGRARYTRPWFVHIESAPCHNGITFQSPSLFSMTFIQTGVRYLLCTVFTRVSHVSNTCHKYEINMVRIGGDFPDQIIKHFASMWIVEFCRYQILYPKFLPEYFEIQYYHFSYS